MDDVSVAEAAFRPDVRVVPLVGLRLVVYPDFMSFPERSDQTGPHGFARLKWFLRGVSQLASIPVLILVSAFVGFAGLAKESGITLVQAVFMTGAIWALPAKVVLIGAITGGNTLPAAAFAVTLSSIRLMPMAVAIVPEMRTSRTSRITLFLLSHFVAVTAWVIAMDRFRHVPREMRTTFFAGVGLTLVTTCMTVVAVVYSLSASLPPTIFAALFFLTPMYFLTSLWGSARDRSGHFAMVAGLALGPVAHSIAPDYDLLLAGIGGGLVAYLGHRALRTRKVAA